MTTISENLQTIKDSTVNIKNAIINKGGAITGNITTYALAIGDLDLSQSTLISTSGILKVDGILGGSSLNNSYTDNVVGIYYMTDINIFAAKSSDDLYYLRWENANDYNNVVNNLEQSREGKIYELNNDYYTVINGIFRRLSETTLAKNITNDLGTSERYVVSQKTVTENLNNLNLLSQEVAAQLNSLGYTYIGVASPSTTPITLTGDEKVFYIATEEGDYSNFGLGNISELSVIKSGNGSWKAEGLGVNLKINDAIHATEDSAFYIVDKYNNIIAKINNEGISTTDVKIKNENGELKTIKDLSSLESIDERYEDTLYVTDSDGNVIVEINKDGIFSPNLPKNDWAGKTMAVYGDSVVAINNGDYIYPFNNIGQKWANYTAAYFNMEKQHGRGIGGQKYAWGTEGGAVSWVRPSGVLIARNDSYTYDNFNGEYPSGVTQQMESDGEAIRCRGSLSSWLRITSQFPKEIKDSIDLVIVMAHNDTSSTDIDVQFVSNDTTDTEWANSGSEYYGKINGDYNISCIKGGIASTIMKLQLWMPNAIIVLATGVSGGGLSGSLNLENINQPILLKIAESVREVGKLTSTPVIDTFATDGINGWNRTTYISDSIHPYTAAGGKMLARAVIGGLKTILPNF